jgi:hypothetical protein
MKLGEIAHMRSGDKGDICNISLIPNDEADYKRIGQLVTAEFVQQIFAPIIKGTVTRYDVPGICSYNFVLTGALGGGVSKTLALDIHGKAYGVLLAEAEIEFDQVTYEGKEHDL